MNSFEKPIEGIDLGNQAELREKCGVVGVYAPEGGAVEIAHASLKALQHRGQDGAGIALVEETGPYRSIRALKGRNRVPEAFGKFSLNDYISSDLAIGHVRYATSETDVDPELGLQPIVRDFALAHNGQLDENKLAELAWENGVNPAGTDSMMLTNILSAAKKRHQNDMEQALQETLPHLSGAFSLSIMTEDTLFAVRDGIRPLVVGELPDDRGTMFASEVGGLNAVGAEFTREVYPGTYIAIDKDGVRQEWWGQGNGSCLFEFVYLSKPENIINGVEVREFRQLAGAMLAQDAPVEADVVVPVLGSGKYYALGYEDASGIPYDQDNPGLAKNPNRQNKDSDRTFIAPTQDEREAAVRDKFVAVPEIVDGRSVVLVDDSIVRGTTMKVIIQMLREAGAREVHVRVPSSPYINPCNYGVAVQDREQLLAHNRTVEQMKDVIKADSLAFLGMERVKEAAGKLVGKTACTGCMDGRYPTSVSDDLDLLGGKIPAFA